jgi:hypothetical protein
MNRFVRLLRRQAWQVCYQLCRGEALCAKPDGMTVRLVWDYGTDLPAVIVEADECSVPEQVRQAMANLDAIERRQAEIARQQQADIAQADHGD